MAEKTKDEVAIVDFVGVLTAGGESFPVEDVTLQAGFGEFPTATMNVVLPEAGAKTVNFETSITLLKRLKKLEGQKGSLVLTIASKTTSLNGFIVSPGVSIRRKQNVSFLIKLVHTDAKIADLNLGIYDLTPSIVSEDSNKAVKVPGDFISAPTIGSTIKSVASALYKAYEAPDTTSSISGSTKAHVHARNTTLKPLLFRFIECLDSAGGPNWKPHLQAHPMDNLLQQLYNHLTLRSSNFVTNMTTLSAAFGLSWYTRLNQEFSLGACSLHELAFSGETGESFKYAPVGISFPAPAYGTATGLAPTHAVVESRTKASFLTDFEAPDSLIASYPGGSFTEKSSIVKSYAPSWMPDAGNLVPIHRAGTNPISIDKLDKQDKDKKQNEKSQLSGLQTICMEWAKLEYARRALLPVSCMLTLPLDLSIDPGKRYTYDMPAGKLSGVVWSVRHSIRAGTTSVFLNMASVV